jgi:hypothetical protein
MRRDDLCAILDKMPPHDLTKVVLILRFNTAITLDSVLRKEEEYVVVRGREAGTNDEGRAFFVPYDDVLCVKLDRVVKASEVKRLYGETVEEETDLNPVKSAEGGAKADGIVTPPPVAPMDPAAIAKQNLLARIRAARTGSKLPS